MTSFQNTVQLIDEWTRHLSNSCISRLLSSQTEINDVIHMLSDQRSKDIYCRELAVIAMGSFVRADIAAETGGNFSPKRWDSLMKSRAGAAQRIGLIGRDDDSWVGDQCALTTFVLEQYRYGDLVRVEPGDICIDLGACLGDASVWMLQNKARSVYAFETDPENVIRLKESAKCNKAFEAIHIVEMAAADARGSAFYIPAPDNIGGGRVSSAMPSHDKFTEIHTITLDDFCYDNNIVPDYIKMDIEGGELAAINGSAKTFWMCRPRFAICIYHSLEDHWRIPLRLAELCPDYDFYLKKSAPYGELVFFGCPREHMQAMKMPPYQPELDNFAYLMPDGINLWRKILTVRPDVADIIDKNTPCSNFSTGRLLLWAWLYGRHELDFLAEQSGNLKEAIEKLGSIPHKAGVPEGYSRLVHLVWISTPELSKYDPMKPDGLNMILNWMKNNGIRSASTS